MRIGDRITNPGELRTLITLQSVTLTKGPGGVQVPSYANLNPATVYAKWSNAHGREVLDAQALKTEAPATVWIRYRADVNTRISILKGAERYQVLSVDNVQERGEYMELKVLLVKGGV